MVRIVASPRMASLTSLHLGGRALALATFESAADLETLPEAADRIGGRVAMLGGGTNILAADGELPVVLVRCGMDEAPAVIGEDGGLRLVRVGAGVKLPRLLVWCMKHGLSGLEGMAGVPGDVGGAVAGNAGAHGMDMGTVLRSVDVFSPDRGFRTLGREDVRCEYRFFGLRDGGKPWFAISGIVLALRRRNRKRYARPCATISNASCGCSRSVRGARGASLKTPRKGRRRASCLTRPDSGASGSEACVFPRSMRIFWSTKVRAARTPRLSSSVRRRAPYGNGLGSNCRRK